MQPPPDDDPAPPAARGRAVVALLIGGVVAAMIALAMFGFGGTNGAATRIGVILIGGLVVVLAGVAAWAGLRMRTKRTREAPRLAATRLGLQYRPTGRRDDLQAYGPLPGVPDRGQITHLMQGSLDGRSMTLYCHTTMVQTGYATLPMEHTVALCAAPEWPVVRIAPRSWLGRLLRPFGFWRGLALDRPDFNRAFHVRADDADFAIALIGPELQSLLLSHPGVTWQVLSGVVATISRGALRSDGVEAAIDRLRRFWELVPDELEHW